LNIGPLDVILVKENIVQLPHIDHFATPAALVKVALFGLAQLAKISGIHRKSVYKSSMAGLDSPAL
jgi:hypothetical protein